MSEIPNSSAILEKGNSQEKLQEPIKVIRNMSASEFSKFLNGEQITQEAPHTEDMSINTADKSTIWFSPNRKQVVDAPITTEKLVDENSEELDFAEITSIWQLGRGGANDTATRNVMIEFATDKKPEITFGKYGEEWIKEYTYEEYDNKDFAVLRVFDPREKEILFDESQVSDEERRKEILSDISDRLIQEEQEMERQTEQAYAILAKVEFGKSRTMINGEWVEKN